MTEEKMDEMIKRAAASYNAPPAFVPKEEMWSAIRAARTSGPRIVYGSAPRRDFGLSHISGRVWLGAAAAAALLVVAGIGVGRWSAPSPASTVAVAVPPKSPAVRSDEPGSAGVTAPEKTAVEGGSSASPVIPDAPGESPVRVAQNSARGTHRDFTPLQKPVTSVRDRSSSSAYQLVTLTHLSDAEAMLTSFRSHTDEKMDAAMGKWARDLLTNTRLLLDSPAAADPRRRQLLEDLELTLVDIVQLSPASGTQDRQMIEKNLDQGHVITRLRTAIPAGMQKGS